MKAFRVYRFLSVVILSAVCAIALSHCASHAPRKSIQSQRATVSGGDTVTDSTTDSPLPEISAPRKGGSFVYPAGLGCDMTAPALLRDSCLAAGMIPESLSLADSLLVLAQIWELEKTMSHACLLALAAAAHYRLSLNSFLLANASNTIHYLRIDVDEKQRALQIARKQIQTYDNVVKEIDRPRSDKSRMR